MEAKEIIKQYLERMAQQDANFKAKFEDKDKSLDECMNYVTEQARKQAVNNAACISDEEVFGWAVHYYQEKDVKPKTKAEAKVVAKPTEPKKSNVVAMESKPEAKKESKGKPERKELDLFGGL